MYIVLVMPFQVKKVGDKYKLWRLKEKTFVKREYKTKESAIAAAKNFMKYRKEAPIVKGNKIITKNYKY